MKNELFPVAILAGGRGERLQPVTDLIPKSLVEVNGEPFIAHQLRLLSQGGITQVILCVGYRGTMIQAAVGDGKRFGIHVEFSFDGPHLRGTAGAIKKALPLLGKSFFVLYGDSYVTCDYHGIQTAFKQSGRLALMTIFKNDGRFDRSNVKFADGRIMAYDKQNWMPGMQHIDYGLGVFNRNAFDFAPDGRSSDLATVYQNLLNQGELAAYEVRERFYEIGSFSGLEEMRRYIAQQTLCQKGTL